MRWKQEIDHARIRRGLGLLALLGWGLTGRAEPFPSGFGLPAHDSLPPIAQASAAAEAVPAEVLGWFDQASSADDRGDYAEALQLQERVMAWVKGHLGPLHPFRANALNNLSIYLSKLGRRAEALPPSEEAVGIYRELAKSNPAFRPGLALSLTNLGNRYSDLGRRAEALPPSEESVVIYRELAKSNPAFLPDLARSLTNLGVSYSDLGRRAEALPPSEESVVIYRELAKSNPAFLPDLARSLSNLGVFLSELGLRAEALPPSEEAVGIRRELAKSNPAFRPDLARSLNDLGNRYSELGRRAEALPPSEESVVIYRELAKSNPAFRPDLALSLTNLGIRYSELGRRAEALPPSEESVGIYRELAKSNPAFRPDLARSFNNLGKAYSELGRRAEALPPSEEAVVIYRELAKSNPAFRPDLASSLTNLGNAYSELGRRAEALPPSEEAVGIRRELAKSNPAFRPDLALSLANLGVSYSDLGRRAEALPPSEEAVGIYRELAKSNPAFRPDLALSLNNLGKAYSELGRRAEALPPSEEAVRIRRELAKSNPAFRPDLALSLANLGVSYSDLGRRAEALPPSEEAVGIYRELAKSNPAFRPDLAGSLNSLGIRYSDLGRRAEALPPSEEAVVIYRELAKSNPAFRPDLASSLNNLGAFLSELGRRAEALPPTEEAVRIRRELAKSNPAFRPDLASSLTNLGIILNSLGRRAEALPPSEEAVGIYRELAKSNPAFRPDLAQSAKNLADLRIQAGEAKAAGRLLREMVASEVLFLQGQLPLLPEARRQTLMDTFGSRWQTSFSLADQSQGGTSVALFTRLNRHGLLQDIERRQGLLARTSGSLRDLVESFTAVTTRLADPSLAADQREDLQRQREGLEQELYGRLPALKPRLVEPADVARTLPADGVLVEFQRHRPYDSNQPEDKRWGEPRYLALMLNRKGSITAVDLGPAADLDALIAEALASTREERPGSQRLWAALADRIFSPLQPHLAGHRQWFLSPDGELNRFPLTALPALAAGRSWLPPGVEVRLLTSGRDLLPTDQAAESASQPLVLANPTFRGWQPLEGTEAEGKQVAAALGVPLRQGPQATAKILQSVRGPRVLHVASHGFFEESPENGDPLLASGIVLAGADRNALPGQRPATQPRSSPAATTDSPDDDGYLTAREAARLQLDGTDLVVLSACDTATGSIRSGEGVYGLQRSLTVAGAQATLLSLWKVDDAATAWFMQRFYDRLGKGNDPGEALLAVQEEFRAQPKVPGWSHPFYWAAWQLTGNGTKLAP